MTVQESPGPPSLDNGETVLYNDGSPTKGESMYDYDPEAVIQDADIELAEMRRVAYQVDRLRKKGICCHTSSIGVSATGEIFHPEQVGLKPGQQKCTDICGRVFESDEEMYHDAHQYL